MRNHTTGTKFNKTWRCLCGNSCRSMKDMVHITLGGVRDVVVMQSQVDDEDHDLI